MHAHTTCKQHIHARTQHARPHAHMHRQNSFVRQARVASLIVYVVGSPGKALVSTQKFTRRPHLHVYVRACKFMCVCIFVLSLCFDDVGIQCPSSLAVKCSVKYWYQFSHHSKLIGATSTAFATCLNGPAMTP